MEVVGYTVVDDTADRILVVVQGLQNVVIPGLPEDINTVQQIIVPDSVDSLAGADAVGIVGVGNAVKGLQLSALLSGQGMTQIVNGVALGIVGNLLAVIDRKPVVPALAVGVPDAVLLQDVAVVVVLHHVYDFAVDRLRQQLAQSIVGVLGYALNRICHLGDALLSIAL